MKIVICPKCENHKIKTFFRNDKYEYQCLKCGRRFIDNTKK